MDATHTTETTTMTTMQIDGVTWVKRTLATGTVIWTCPAADAKYACPMYVRKSGREWVIVTDTQGSIGPFRSARAACAAVGPV